MTECDHVSPRFRLSPDGRDPARYYAYATPGGEIESNSRVTERLNEGVNSPTEGVNSPAGAPRGPGPPPDDVAAAPARRPPLHGGHPSRGRRRWRGSPRGADQGGAVQRVRPRSL
eukprot:1193461-Prorocentrum_minimum.AAC.1